MEQKGKIIMLAGAVIMLAGLVIWWLGDRLRFIGRLPGDVHIVRGNVRIYIPVTTMLLVSIVLSLFLWLVQKFRH